MLPFSVVIPIYNALQFAERQLAALENQSLRPETTIVLDSKSSDGSSELFKAAGCSVVAIEPADFDHGSTRNLGADRAATDIVIFLTQDAIPDPDAFAVICKHFAEDPAVAVVCGRQKARASAGAIERHARIFNYPPNTSRRRWPDAKQLGIKAIFNSNSFAAYRKSAFTNGLFPSRTIMGEDQIAVAKALLAGWTIVYAAEAVVEHSHAYSLSAEFKRYFDIGVFHAQHRSLLRNFSSPSDEGRRFVTSEIRYLLQNKPQRIPEAIVRTAVKMAGYHLGKRETRLPVSLKLRLAMNRGYFTSHPGQLRTSAVRPRNFLTEPGD